MQIQNSGNQRNIFNRCQIEELKKSGKFLEISVSAYSNKNKLILSIIKFWPFRKDIFHQTDIIIMPRRNG